jgi:hypothetical protein
MSRNIRIQTKPNDGDKYVKVKLDHSFDFLEILSLRLTQADVYRKFAADYGVIVGRVIANGGFGVPNAKVSVFIPLDSNESNPLIKELYPYQTINDVNNQGIRYNLLEDLAQRSCHTPVGTFPNKRKVLDNDVWLEIYDKYYKFTTSTNFAGDFMLFGVPTGNQNMHMDVDLSNIDYISLKPYDLIEQGYTETLFESKTNFKSGTDLGSLVQIQSKDYAVNVLPFWGDLEENEVGINRVDFVLNTEIIPNATFFGSIFTDSKKSSIRKQCQPRETLGKNCDLATGVGNIEMIRRVSNTSNEVELIQIESKQIDENGNWAFTIPMNLNKFITDEFGNLVPSEDPNVGIATTTKVRFRMAIKEHLNGLKFRNAHYLVPNMYNNYQFGSDTEDFDFFEMRWKKVYTVTNYIPRYQKAEGSPTYLHTAIKDIGECENTQSFPFNRLKTNPTFFFTILCIFITIFAIIIDLINRLIGFIVFEVIIALICFVKHPFSNRRRSACRCKGCLDLNSGLQNPPTPTLPAGWNPSCTDCIECAVCYNGDDSSSSSYSFKETTTLVPPDINIIFNGGGLLNDGTYTVTSGNFFSISTPPTVGTFAFKLVVSGGNLTKVLLINQSGLGTQPAYYSTTYTLILNGLSYAGGMFVNPLDYVEFSLEPKDIIILNDVNDATAGTYTVDGTQYTYTGNGQDVIFQATINADGQLGSINIISGEGGAGYLPYFDIISLNEVFSLPQSAIGGVGSPSKLIAFSKDAFQTTFVVDGYPVDCDAFDISICKNECKTCPVSIIKLECNDFEYENIFDWADCVKESLAEGLGLIKYHFYNDWVIGSLYSVLFDYKSRFKKKGKSVERFCDYDCRAPNVDIPTYCPTTPVEKDPNYKHRRNRCNTAYIAESFIFNDGDVPHACVEDTNKWKVLTIESPNNQPTGRGLIIEYKGFFYYAARHDIEINSVTNANLNANKLTVLEKKKLLFATNIIELGSMVSCDRDGEPLVVNNLESTTYQKDNGIGVLYDYSDCFTSCPINRFGTQLMCQAGVEIAFAEISNNPTLVGDDGNDYLLMGNAADIPDYDENNGIIIFDRDDIILRRLLCENFDYYGVSGTYVSTEVPIPPPPYPINPAYLEEVSPDATPNDTLEFTTDQCIGFDDYHTILIAPNEYYAPAKDMPPYYMYFGIRQGQSSLDKLRKNYFDRCID